MMKNVDWSKPICFEGSQSNSPLEFLGFTFCGDHSMSGLAAIRNKIRDDVILRKADGTGLNADALRVINSPCEEPAPTVNWDEPIQFDDGGACELSLTLDHPDRYGYTRFVHDKENNIVIGRFEDGGFLGRGERRVINVPKPVKKVMVGVAVHRDGTKAVVEVFEDGGAAIFDTDGESWSYTSLENAKEIWHILIEPKEVELPE